jgi:two-component system, NtrC family, sensor kinase
MRYLFLFILFISSCSFAQRSGVSSDTIFHIDSLPANGLLLNKGWKWHAGDNPEWAKPEFNDSKWENIDPMKDIFDLPKVSKQGDIFWLRLPLLVSESASKEALIMTIRQSGASEVFLNGKLIQRIGVLSKDKSQIKAFSPGRDPFSLQMQPNHPQILAVRYAFQPNIIPAVIFCVLTLLSCYFCFQNHNYGKSKN